jgi:hypothetical protein
VTLTESQPLQRLQIILREKAELLARKRAENAYFLERLTKIWNRIVAKGEGALKLEVGSDPLTTQKNKQKIDDLFDSMVKKLLRPPMRPVD